jgi:hypothetical protein
MAGYHGYREAGTPLSKLHVLYQLVAIKPLKSLIIDSKLGDNETAGPNDARHFRGYF